jgi:Flp pilus assembly protein TadD
MIRRWLRGCVVPTALCLTAVGCTPSVESLTGGLVTTPSAVSKETTEAPPARPGDLTADEQIRLHLDAARAMDKAGNDEGALPEYERVLKLDPANYTAMRRLCVLYDRHGSKEDFKKAEELYRKVSKVRPNDAEVWNDWGYSLFLRTEKERCKENWAESEKKYRQALKLDPENARAHANLGKLLGLTERYDEAFREFRAAKLNESEVHVDMAFVYMAQGKLDQAKMECRAARELDPANNKARELLADLEQSPHPRDRTAAPGRRDGRTPRANSLTPAQWEAEREAARRAVTGSSASAAAPADDKGVSWQSAGPIVMPSGAKWMPVHPAATPPVTTEGTITLDN